MWGEQDFLAGFEFNIRGKLGTSLFAPFVATIDRAAGDIKEFDPEIPVIILSCQDKIDFAVSCCTIKPLIMSSNRKQLLYDYKKQSKLFKQQKMEKELN